MCVYMCFHFMLQYIIVRYQLTNWINKLSPSWYTTIVLHFHQLSLYSVHFFFLRLFRSLFHKPFQNTSPPHRSSILLALSSFSAFFFLCFHVIYTYECVCSVFYRSMSNNLYKRSAIWSMFAWPNYQWCPFCLTEWHMHRPKDYRMSFFFST